MSSTNARHEEPSAGNHLLVIGAVRDIVARASKLAPSLATSVLCTAEEAKALPSLAEHFRVIVLPDGAPLEDWSGAARYIHAGRPVNQVLCYGEAGQEPAAAVCSALSLPGHSMETVLAVNRKSLMRDRLAAAGVDDTRSIRVTSPEELASFAARVGYPVICKPSGGVGSQGVVRIDSADELAEGLARALAPALDCAQADVIAEKFHQGEEFSVETISEEGQHLPLCITQKFLIPGGFVELGHQVPASLPSGMEDRIHRTVTAALDALGVRNGATHTEVIVNDQDVRIIETHLRQGGDRIPYLLQAARDVDMVEALAHQSAGLPALERLSAQLMQPLGDAPFAAIWYALPGRPGRIAEVRGESEAREVAGVRDVVLRRTAGDTLGAVTCSDDRPAYCWAVGATAQLALDAARTGVSKLSFVMEELDVSL
ncbi:ATP-grasp domain-containing protein [Streptomyces sp. NPDC097595]|uniref:ATP-grasp domain-containing protein n=1 Tax=Streptomyces sp. NPDC097595 TaxID=3366090 RepID=UPI003822D760